MSSKIKKIILATLPYGIVALFATKIRLAWRLAGGGVLQEKIVNISTGFAAAFQIAAISLGIVSEVKALVYKSTIVQKK